MCQLMDMCHSSPHRPSWLNHPQQHHSIAASPFTASPSETPPSVSGASASFTLLRSRHGVLRGGPRGWREALSPSPAAPVPLPPTSVQLALAACDVRLPLRALSPDHAGLRLGCSLGCASVGRRGQLPSEDLEWKSFQRPPVVLPHSVAGAQMTKKAALKLPRFADVI
eukprot:CAMPEP_0181213156 /NCGR_PEP_ID=MMETSP1096-20121128/24748_1 /TAXON_ID=156174 ORGANISM="Chrysochromulina ericina, Strain CCMP281" /NCGR_SAMPLE_ID=MMETSP1096 /ASSEMBLY_ACC=CAM_ASM_000453 /LENGTH=167 /DNA_ID=CAMNT_0023304763 /DNA_START=456 /DNA_END=958 /DNA_ORIENTATION=+